MAVGKKARESPSGKVGKCYCAALLISLCNGQYGESPSYPKSDYQDLIQQLLVGCSHVRVLSSVWVLYASGYAITTKVQQLIASLLTVGCYRWLSHYRLLCPKVWSPIRIVVRLRCRICRNGYPTRINQSRRFIRWAHYPGVSRTRISSPFPMYISPKLPPTTFVAIRLLSSVSGSLSGRLSGNVVDFAPKGFNEAFIPHSASLQFLHSDNRRDRTHFRQGISQVACTTRAVGRYVNPSTGTAAPKPIRLRWRRSWSRLRGVLRKRRS